MLFNVDFGLRQVGPSAFELGRPADRIYRADGLRAALDYAGLAKGLLDEGVAAQAVVSLLARSQRTFRQELPQASGFTRLATDRLNAASR
jgi:hypothetical protein